MKRELTIINFCLILTFASIVGIVALYFLSLTNDNSIYEILMNITIGTFGSALLTIFLSYINYKREKEDILVQVQIEVDKVLSIFRMIKPITSSENIYNELKQYYRLASYDIYSFLKIKHSIKLSVTHRNIERDIVMLAEYMEKIVKSLELFMFLYEQNEKDVNKLYSEIKRLNIHLFVFAEDGIYSKYIHNYFNLPHKIASIINKDYNYRQHAMSITPIQYKGDKK